MADFIENAEFARAIDEHNQECALARQEGREPPVIPRKIGDQFLLLANKLTYHRRFRNYSYKEEMVSEGLIVCCRKIGNFNPTITNNAFAYFTQLCWYAFFDVLNTEREQAYIKAKSYYNMLDEHGSPFEQVDTDEAVGDIHNVQSEFIPYFDVEEFEKEDREKRAKIKSKKRETSVIEDMIEDSTDE